MHGWMSEKQRVTIDDLANFLSKLSHQSGKSTSVSKTQRPNVFERRFPSTPQANGATRWLKHRERQLNDTTSPQPIMKPLPTRSTRSQRVMPTYSYRGSDTSSLFSDSIAPSDDTENQNETQQPHLIEGMHSIIHDGQAGDDLMSDRTNSSTVSAPSPLPDESPDFRSKSQRQAEVEKQFILDHPKQSSFEDKHSTSKVHNIDKAQLTSEKSSHPTLAHVGTLDDLSQISSVDSHSQEEEHIQQSYLSRPATRASTSTTMDSSSRLVHRNRLDIDPAHGVSQPQLGGEKSLHIENSASISLESNSNFEESFVTDVDEELPSERLESSRFVTNSFSMGHSNEAFSGHESCADVSGSYLYTPDFEEEEQETQDSMVYANNEDLSTCNDNRKPGEFKDIIKPSPTVPKASSLLQNKQNQFQIKEVHASCADHLKTREDTHPEEPSLYCNDRYHSKEVKAFDQMRYDIQPSANTWSSSFRYQTETSSADKPESSTSTQCLNTARPFRASISLPRHIASTLEKPHALTEALIIQLFKQQVDLLRNVTQTYRRFASQAASFEKRNDVACQTTSSISTNAPKATARQHNTRQRETSLASALEYIQRNRPKTLTMAEALALVDEEDCL